MATEMEGAMFYSDYAHDCAVAAYEKAVVVEESAETEAREAVSFDDVLEEIAEATSEMDKAIYLLCLVRGNKADLSAFYFIAQEAFERVVRRKTAKILKDDKR